MSSAKKFGLPAEYDNLRSFEFSRAPAPNRSQSERPDKIFNVESLSQLTQEIDKRREPGSASGSAGRAKRRGSGQVA